MKIKAALFFLILTLYIYPQTLHIVQITGNSYSPDEITISIGDTVRWQNNGGHHNVVADDGSFTSGGLSSTLWTYDRVFTAQGRYQYYCSQHGAPGGSGMSGAVEVENPTGVNDDFPKPDYRLKQNYPNPFNPSTKIEYSIPLSEYVTLKVFNVTGSLEKVLVSEFQPQGNYIMEFSFPELTSGVYFYQLKAGSFIQTKRMTLLK